MLTPNDEIILCKNFVYTWKTKNALNKNKQKLKQTTTTTPDQGASSRDRKRASAGSIQRSVEVAPSPTAQSACRAGSLHSISTSSDGSS